MRKSDRSEACVEPMDHFSWQGKHTWFITREYHWYERHFGGKKKRRFINNVSNLSRSNSAPATVFICGEIMAFSLEQLLIFSSLENILSNVDLIFYFFPLKWDFFTALAIVRAECLVSMHNFRLNWPLRKLSRYPLYLDY